MEPNARYPRYLCRECASGASDKSGKKLEFGNTDLSGGFEAVYADTGKKYQSHECFVKGMRCWADEARFGGVVIEALDVSAPRTAGARASIKGRKRISSKRR